MTAVKPNRVRLEDVAARVGVSSSEVSRVLNGRTRQGKTVAAMTQQRIIAAARQLNYRPHRAAQSLAHGQCGMIGLMSVINRSGDRSPFPKPSIFSDAPGELAPHYHEIIGALAYTLNEYGLHLLLAQCGGPDEDPLIAMQHMARSRLFDGLIITDMLVDDPRPKLLDEAGLPYVVRGSTSHPGCVSVGADNVALGYTAIRYLHHLGHRRILFFNLRQDFMSGLKRYEGALKAGSDFGLLDTLEFRHQEHHPDTVEEFLRARAAQPDFPTAIFAEDEMVALSVERALAALGLSVPGDVSLLTCLNARFMHLISPHLTVLDIQQHEIASQAAHLMAKMLSGQAIERRQNLIAPVLREHGSTASPCR